MLDKKLNEKIRRRIDEIFSSAGPSQELFDLKEEIGTSIKEKVNEYRQTGMDEDQAIKEAFISMGNLNGLVEDMRRAGQDATRRTVYRSMTERVSIAGIALGSAINFALGRLFGQSLLRLFIPDQKLDKLRSLLNGQRSKSTLLILFLLPGVPKDILCYIGGFLPIRPLSFLIITNLARIPALLITCYVGANLRQENYLLAGIVTGAACLILLLAVLLKKRIARIWHRKTILSKRRARISETIHRK